MNALKPIESLVGKLLQGPAVRYRGALGVFHYVDDAAEAVRTLRQLGHRDLRVYSPVPYHDIEKALEQGPSLVRWITFTGGVLGFTAGLALCIYSVISYPLVTGGKELTSLPPFIGIGYESMILLATLSNLLAMLALGRLPQLRSKAPYDPRCSEDRIGIWVPCEGERLERVQELLRGHGAEEVKTYA